MPVSALLPAGTPFLVAVAVRTSESFVRHEMTTYAAALAYRGLLALFPFVIFSIAIVASLDVWRLFEMLSDWARTAPEGRVPNAIKQWMVYQVRERAGSAVLSVGAVAAVWAVASGARVLRRALNIAGNIPEVQPAWVRLGLSFVAAPVLSAAVLAVVLLFTVTRDLMLRIGMWFQLNTLLVSVWDWVRLPAGVMLAGIVIAIIYRFAPSQRQPVRALVPGAIAAAIVWAVASFIFSRAVSSVLQFGVTYGGSVRRSFFWSTSI